MKINFKATKRMQANIDKAVFMLNSMERWLEVENKYKKDDSRRLVEDGKQLVFNSHTEQPVEDYVLSVLWKLSFPIIFDCTDEELPKAIEDRYGDYSDSYKKILLNAAREHNPIIEDIEQEFIENLSNYDPDSINSLIQIYRKQWKGHIPNVTLPSNYYKKAYDDAEHPLYNVFHEAETNGLLDFYGIHVISSRMDWIAQALKSLGEGINTLFEKWEEPAQRNGKSCVVSNEGLDNNNDSGTMKVKTDVLTEIFKKAGITVANSDKTKISQLIAYLTGYSSNTIRQRLTNKEELTSAHKTEVDNVNKLLKELNTSISIKYNNNR